MTYLLDTNTCIALLRDSSIRVARNYEGATARGNIVATSSIVVYELWYGVFKSARAEENSATLLRFLRGPISILSFDQEDARAAGVLRAELARSGKTIGSYDTLIAAQCFSKRLTVVTSKTREFRRVSGLRCEDWMK